MAEEGNKPEGTPAQEPVAPPAEPSKTQSLVEKSEAIAARMEAANIKTAELLTRQEELKATEILGGQAEAGQEPEPKKGLTDEEYKNKILTGEVPDETQA